MKNIALSIALTILFPIFAISSSYAGNIDGYNKETGAYVGGHCNSDGSCSGYDNDTKAYVGGTCNNGNFDGYNKETGAYVGGSC